MHAPKLLDKFGRTLKPSFFSGRSDFYETLNFLDSVLAVLQQKQTSNPLPSTPGRVWSPKIDLEQTLGFKLRTDEFERLTHKLDQLSIREHSKLTDLSSLLDLFTCTKTLQAQARKASYSVQQIDERGISQAAGRRKDARASVWLRPVPREDSNVPLVVINDAPVHEFFSEKAVKEWAQIWTPFEVTQTLGEYAVYAKVSGGGESGQAQAVRHAISNALVKQDTRHFEALEAKNLLETDWRRLERKKPGKPKARRSEQWSKR